MKISTLADRLRPIPVCEAVLVIDVLRATSTIATALGAGALSIVPCISMKQARAIARARGALLVGERKGAKPRGFALGNSPLEFTANSVGGRHLVMTTTNGTRALEAARAGPGSPAVACLALTNRAALVTWLRQSCYSSITLCCSGDEGSFSGEDLAGAGALIAGLRGTQVALELDDLSQVAESWFQFHHGNLISMLLLSTHGQRLQGLGHGQDLQACAQLDSVNAVPVYEDPNSGITAV